MTEAIRLLQRFMDRYLRQSDLNEVLSCVTEDVVCVGLAHFSKISNREELKQALLSEQQHLEELFFSIEETREKDLGETVLVSFSLHFQNTAKKMDDRWQGSMALCRENGKLKIAQLHLSKPEQSKEHENFYPRVLEEGQLSFKNAIKEKGVALLNRIVPGGMMGGYIEEKFPLYFINDRMLEYLGYTYAEFMEDTKGYVINCIHPDDRAYVDKVVEQSFRSSEEYRVKYRMKKKDGSYIWVDDYGRRVVSEQGRPAIISVCMDITESIHMQEELKKKTQKLLEKNRELEHFYNTVFSATSKVASDAQCTRIYASDRYYEMLGYGKDEHDELDQMSRWDIVLEEDRKELQHALKKANDGTVASYKFRMRKKDGTYLWVKMDARLSDETYHGYRVFHCLYTNIDAQREAELAEKREQYYTSLLLTISTAGTVVVYHEPNYPFAYVGENLISFLGYHSKEFHQQIQNYLQLCYAPDVPDMIRSIDAQLAQRNYYEVEYRIQKKDGSLVWVLEKGKLAQDMEGKEVLVCVLLDHSSQKRTKDRLWEKSVLDPLTKVYNRGAASQAIEHYLKENPGCSAALFILDLDDFKRINDHYGHMVGDTVLIQVASVLRQNLRQEDIVARLGGDEFILFVKEIAPGPAVEGRASGICELMKKEVSGCVEKEEQTVSIGVALAGTGPISFETLYRNADIALYRAKCKGKNTYAIYDG